MKTSQHKPYYSYSTPQGCCILQKDTDLGGVGGGSDLQIGGVFDDN